MGRGSRIEIEDRFWKEPEIQGALKLGIVSIVGNPPVFPEEALNLAPKQLIAFRNVYSTKLCFECIKDYADPGRLLYVPVERLEETEIRNAILNGWLINEDNPESNPVQRRGPPVNLEELTTSDLIDSDTADDLASILTQSPAQKAEPLPENVPASRPVKKQAASPIKAKAISRSGDGEGEEVELDDLYRPSEVRVPKQPSRRRNTDQAPSAKAPLPKLKQDTESFGDDDFDLTEIFTSKQPKGK